MQAHAVPADTATDRTVTAVRPEVSLTVHPVTIVLRAISVTALRQFPAATTPPHTVPQATVPATMQAQPAGPAMPTPHLPAHTQTVHVVPLPAHVLMQTVRTAAAGPQVLLPAWR